LVFLSRTQFNLKAFQVSDDGSVDFRTFCRLSLFSQKEYRVKS